MTKIINFIIFFLLTLSLSMIVSGYDVGQYYKADNQVMLNSVCQFNGTVCPSTSLCNLTIINPNNKIIINNQPMLKNNTINFFVLNTTTHQNVLGDYKLNIDCYNMSSNVFYVDYVQMNNSGKKIDNLLPFFILFIFIFVAVFGFMIWFGISGNPILQGLIFPFAFLLMLCFTMLMFFCYRNTIDLSSLFYKLYWTSMLMTFVVMVLTLWDFSMFIIMLFGRKGKAQRRFNDGY